MRIDNMNNWIMGVFLSEPMQLKSLNKDYINIILFFFPLEVRNISPLIKL